MHWQLNYTSSCKGSLYSETLIPYAYWRPLKEIKGEDNIFYINSILLMMGSIGPKHVE
jgi:hypothetical protein